MTQPQKNTSLALAIALGLISLPLTWMTIRGATFQGGPADVLNLAFREMIETVEITALDGYVTLLFKAPIWSIVCVSILASVLQLMRSSEVFAIPRLAEWATSFAGLAWMSLAVVCVVSSGKASLSIGCLLGLTAAVIPVVCLAVPLSPSNPPAPHDADSAIAS